MSIAWATVVIVVLLAPGFLFFFGLYAPSQVTRETVPFSPLGQLAGVVIISFAIHAIAYALINSEHFCKTPRVPAHNAIPCVDFDQLASLLRIDGAVPQGKSPPSLNTMLDKHVVHILSYFAVVGVSAFLLGWLCGFLVASGNVPLLRHQYLELLEGGRRQDQSTSDNASQSQSSSKAWVRAHVLSQTEHDGNVLIYDGVVRDFYSKADGTISYIVLRDARRGVLKISDEVSKAAPARNRLSDNELSEALGGLLVLTSNDIANVYLERLSQVQSGSADEALLTERLNQLEAPAHDDSFSLD